jgi:hypothetical protein
MSLTRQQLDFGPVKCRLAEQTYEAPETPGIYGWYYVPKFTDEAEFASKLSALCMSAGSMEGRVRIDYGVSLNYEAQVVPRYERRGELDLISEALNKNLPAMRGAFENFLVPFFTRPIYIGMAKNLKQRLYNDHYKEMLGHWEPRSPVSMFLQTYNRAATPHLSVDDLMTKLSLTHSFALDARVRGFPPRELKAYFIETNEFEPGASEKLTDEEERMTRRTIERLFQLICLPVCGRI